MDMRQAALALELAQVINGIFFVRSEHAATVNCCDALGKFKVGIGPETRIARIRTNPDLMRSLSANSEGVLSLSPGLRAQRATLGKIMEIQITFEQSEASAASISCAIIPAP